MKGYDLQEINWWTTLIIPIVIVVIGAIISYLLNRAKTKAEIKKLGIDANKAEEEIQKLIEETKNLKKSFQPIVISTLQNVQNKVLDEKISGLRKINAIYSEFIEFPQQHDEGDPVTPSEKRRLDLIFRNFSQTLYEEFKEFHNTYSYVYSDTAFNDLSKLYEYLADLSEINKSWQHEYDGLIVPNDEDLKSIEQIINQFKKTQITVRKDCYLDSEFIHEFLSENSK